MSTGTEALGDRDVLTHVQRLESEVAHIIREAVAESANPVMLRSIGKDSSVMLHVARKAFIPGEEPQFRSVRFRTLGCYPLTRAIESTADTLPAVVAEMLLVTTSEGQGRRIDHDQAGAAEEKKDEGYF